MLIDWFTVGAQTVNFLILVALLRYFLYDRIVRAMDAREQAIASRVDEAARKQQEAERLAEEYRRKSEEVEEAGRRRLAAVQREADATRTELMEQVRTEVDQAQARWRAALKRDQEEFLRDLRTQIVQHVHGLTRRVLGDLAQADLEQRMVRTFVQRLDRVDESVREALAGSLGERDGTVLISSAFDLPPDLREALREALHKRLGRAVDLRLEVKPELICGLEIKVGGRKLGWNAAGYLAELEERVRQVLEEPAAVQGGEPAPPEDRRENPEEDHGT